MHVAALYGLPENTSAQFIEEFFLEGGVTVRALMGPNVCMLVFESEEDRRFALHEAEGIMIEIEGIQHAIRFTENRNEDDDNDDDDDNIRIHQQEILDGNQATHRSIQI